MEAVADVVGDSTGSNRQKLLLNSFKIVEKRSAVVINLREMNVYQLMLIYKVFFFFKGQEKIRDLSCWVK